ncbi:MAG: site-2 protease family protein [Deltaproteobacteria bacterium]|nr:site-2 protease family protein [Deltaproteobacteria bacterium]
MSIAISIFAIGLLIALHEAGHFFAARRVGMKVIRYSIGLLKAIVSWTSKKTGITYQIGILPLGGFVQIKGMNPFEDGAFEDADSYQTKSVWRRMLVVVGGPVVNLLVAWAVLFGLYVVGNPEYVNKPGVGDVVSGGPADKAGLETGDYLISLNGEKLETWKDLVKGLQSHPDERVALEVKRGDNKLAVEVTPMNMDGIGKIGIGQPRERISLPVHIAALAAAQKCAQVIGDTISGIAMSLTGSGGDLQTVGPVGIVKMAATTLNTGFREFLALVAYLSVMLFMFNLFPLPALDGGRAVFLFYEAVTRKQISPKVDAIVNTVGFVLLIGLIGAMTIKELFVG